MIERTAFAKAIAPLSAATGREFTRDQAEVWYDRLKDLPLEALRAAVLRCLTERESEWLPPVATIRRLAWEFENGTPLSGEEALLMVRDAQREVDRLLSGLTPRERDDRRGGAIRAMRRRLGADICSLLDRMGWSNLDERRFVKLWERSVARLRLSALPVDCRPARIGIDQPQHGEVPVAGRIGV